MTTGKELYRLVVQKEKGQYASTAPWGFLSWLRLKQKGTDPTPGSINSKVYEIAKELFENQKSTLPQIDPDFEDSMSFNDWLSGTAIGQKTRNYFSPNIDRVFTVENIFGGCGLEDFIAIYDPLLTIEGTENLLKAFGTNQVVSPNVGNDSRAVEVNFNPCSTSETNLDAYLEILVAEIYENAGLTAIFKEAEEEERSGPAGIINSLFGDNTLSEELLSGIAEKQELFRDSIYFKNVRFKEQCFLLSNVFKLVSSIQIMSSILYFSIVS